MLFGVKVLLRPNVYLRSDLKHIRTAAATGGAFSGGEAAREPAMPPAAPWLALSPLKRFTLFLARRSTHLVQGPRGSALRGLERTAGAHGLRHGSVVIP